MFRNVELEDSQGNDLATLPTIGRVEITCRSGTKYVIQPDVNGGLHIHKIDSLHDGLTIKLCPTNSPISSPLPQTSNAIVVK